MAQSVYQSFKRIFAFVFVSLFFVNASAQISDYEFPEFTSDISTICSPAIHVPESPSEEFKVEVYKSKGEIKRSKLELRFYPAQLSETMPKKRPGLLVILAGLGGDHRSVFSKFYAQQAQAAGYDVLVFPNTFTRNFIMSSSTRGLVGETPMDGLDVYRALNYAVRKLELKKGIEAGPIKILGFSHGALLAVAVDAINQSDRAFEIQSVLMVNPPVSLLAGLRDLDARAKAASKIPFPRLVKLGLRFLKALKRNTAEPTTIDTFRKFSQELRYKPHEAYAIIGLVMKDGLDDVILASQEVEDLGIVPILSPEGSATRRQEENALRSWAKRFSYEKYINTFFGARAKKDGEPYSIEALEAVSSLPAYENHLRQSRHITLIHNLDDILLKQGDAEWLRGVFGARANFYPRGGHLGNVWVKHNLNAYKNWLLN